MLSGERGQDAEEHSSDDDARSDQGHSLHESNDTCISNIVTIFWR
jgi:hypothetical protein